MEYLGYITDSEILSVTLPEQKKKKIVESCKKLSKPYDLDDVMVPSWKNLGLGTGDVNMLLLNKMAW